MVGGGNQEARTILFLVVSGSWEGLSNLVLSLSCALVAGTENIGQ